MRLMLEVVGLQVTAAYHKACISCAADRKSCPFCIRTWKDIAEDDAAKKREGEALVMGPVHPVTGYGGEYVGSDSGDDDSGGEGSEDDGGGGGASRGASWGSSEVCLEVQAPFARAIAGGFKTIETRGYALPEELVGVPIKMIETIHSEVQGTTLCTLLLENTQGPHPTHTQQLTWHDFHHGVLVVCPGFGHELALSGASGRPGGPAHRLGRLAVWRGQGLAQDEPPRDHRHFWPLLSVRQRRYSSHLPYTTPQLRPPPRA